MRSETDIQESVDHLFRHHAGQMVSVLSRIFGLDKLDLIEDAVQDSLVAALQKWPFSGFPDNPRAWLIQVAKNRLLDGLRQSGRLQSGDEEVEKAERSLEYLEVGLPAYFTNEINDDQLRLIFACCHPAIHADSQVALTLKIVGGFSVAEIARAFLAKDEAIAKLLTRAKHKLRDGKIELEIPPPDSIPPRLDAVLKVLYLMFNEGYGASDGDELIRKDLCFEAIRLSESLSRHPVTTSPKVHALTALFLFQAARLPARSDIHGGLLLLAEQDRTLWDQEMIGRAADHLNRSASGEELTDFHIEAEIAAIHSLATSFESTDWPRILACYDLLQSRRFSPVIELNRIIALGEVRGAKAAFAALTGLENDEKLRAYPLFHITKGHFFSEIGDEAAATHALEVARSLTHNDVVRKFISKKIIISTGSSVDV